MNMQQAPTFSMLRWPAAGPAGAAVCRTDVRPPALGQSNSAPAAPAGLAAAAGDHSVTLSWSNPNDSSITGYEYRVNHNDTATGRLSGWSGWTGISGSGSSSTSHAFTGLANGKEYRYQLRAVNANGAGPGAPNGSPWYVSASPAAPPTQAPDTPGSIAITRADGSLTASWDPTHGADRYHVTYSSDHRQSWNAAASPGDNHSANRVVINADNAMAAATFTTGAGLTVTNIKATSATLNLAGHSGQWWYDADTGPHTACQGPVAAGNVNRRPDRPDGAPAVHLHRVQRGRLQQRRPAGVDHLRAVGGRAESRKRDRHHGDAEVGKPHRGLVVQADGAGRGQLHGRRG